MFVVAVLGLIMAYLWGMLIMAGTFVIGLRKLPVSAVIGIAWIVLLIYHPLFKVFFIRPLSVAVIAGMLTVAAVWFWTSQHKYYLNS